VDASIRMALKKVGGNTTRSEGKQRWGVMQVRGPLDGVCAAQCGSVGTRGPAVGVGFRSANRRITVTGTEAWENKRKCGEREREKIKTTASIAVTSNTGELKCFGAMF